MRRLNAGCATGIEEALQSFVAERFDHRGSIARCALRNNLGLNGVACLTTKLRRRCRVAWSASLDRLVNALIRAVSFQYA